MDNDELIQELRADRLLRALQAEGEQVNAAFDARLAANAEVLMFADELNTDDPIARNREGFFKAAVVNPWKSPRRDNSSDEPSDEDGEPLEKRASNSRRREAIKTFVARQLALGIPFEQIVAGAEENDLPTANLMRECYAEMQAA